MFFRWFGCASLNSICYFALQVNGVVTTGELAKLKESLEEEIKLRKAAEEEVSKLKSQSTLKTRSGVTILQLCLSLYISLNCLTNPSDVLGRRRCWNIKITKAAGGWGSSEKETWRRGHHFAKSACAAYFWSWPGTNFRIWMSLSFNCCEGIVSIHQIKGLVNLPSLILQILLILPVSLLLV